MKFNLECEFFKKCNHPIDLRLVDELCMNPTGPNCKEYNRRFRERGLCEYWGDNEKCSKEKESKECLRGGEVEISLMNLYNNICSHKGISENGEPCKIREFLLKLGDDTWKIRK